MFEIKAFGKEIFSFGKKTFQTIDSALRWLETQWDNSDSKVTKGNAYPKHVWVYACVNAIARNLAQVPFRLYKKGTDTEVVSGPVYELFRDPSPTLSRYQLWEGEEIFRNIRGEAFWHLIRGPNFVVEIEFLEPDNMKPIVVDGIIQMWKYTRTDGRTISILPEDIVHFKFYNPANSFRGLSPLTAAMLGIEIDDDARRFDRNVLRNGTYPGSLVEVEETMNDEQFKRFKQEIQVSNQGINKAGRIMLLEGGAKFKEIKITAQELQFMERKKMAMIETAAIYKVPPIELGDFENSGRSDSMVQTKMFWTRTLIPAMRYIEDVLNTMFFPQNFEGIEGRFDIDGIKELQEDLKTAAETATAFWKMGVPFSVINDRMDLGFDLKGVKGLDVGLLPFNLAPVEDIVAGIPDDPAPAPEPDKMQKALEYFKTAKLDEGVAIIPEKDRKHYIHWKRLIQKVNPLIGRMQSKIKRYFFEARLEVLDRYTDLTKSVKGITSDQLFNKKDELKKLQAAARPFIEAAIMEGGQDTFTELGIEGVFSITNQRTVDYFNGQMIRLAQITDTIAEEIRLTLQEGVAQGLTPGDIVEALKHDFNVAGNRARTIARTEIISSANGGRVQGYIEHGVERHEWVNSFDKDVREEHQFSEIVDVGEEFQNGLKWPGDKDGSGSTPENVINCRCTTIAVFKE